jgi:hypothetical protein
MGIASYNKILNIVDFFCEQKQFIYLKYVNALHEIINHIILCNDLLTINT